jgi:enoyl-CoA hydratase/carnithine racemase
LEMILSGEPVDAGRAAHWGLVDIVVPRKELMSRARDLVLRLTNDTHRAGLRQKGVRCASC